MRNTQPPVSYEHFNTRSGGRAPLVGLGAAVRSGERGGVGPALQGPRGRRVCGVRCACSRSAEPPEPKNSRRRALRLLIGYMNSALMGDQIASASCARRPVISTTSSSSLKETNENQGIEERLKGMRRSGRGGTFCIAAWKLLTLTVTKPGKA